MDAYTNINFTPELLRAVANFSAGPPPPGVVPDFEHQASNGLMLWITIGICLPVMVLAVLLRLYAKYTGSGKTFNWSDIMLVISLLGSISWIITSIISVSGKFFGRHMWEIKIKYIDKNTVLLSITGEAFWPIWFLLIKLAVFAMYLELFGVKRWLRWGCYVGMGALTCFHVAAALFYAISCSPIGGQDDMAYLMGFVSKRCLKIFPIIIMQAAVNMAGDIYLMILPIPAVWRLNMPLKKKLGICAMFFTGFTCLVASTCSLYYRIELHSATDLTWLSVVPWVTSIYEMMAGIVVCCMPSLTALGRRWSAPFRDLSEKSKNSWSSFFSSHKPRRYPGLRFRWVTRSNATNTGHTGSVSTAVAANATDDEEKAFSQVHVNESFDSHSTPPLPPQSHPQSASPAFFSQSDQVQQQQQQYSYPAPGTGNTYVWQAHQPPNARTWVGRGGDPIAIHEAHIANASIQKRTEFDVVVYDESNRF